MAERPLARAMALGRAPIARDGATAPGDRPGVVEVAAIDHALKQGTALANLAPDPDVPR